MYLFLTFKIFIYIAEVLEIPEQILFDDSSRARKIYLKHILNSISAEERQLLQSSLCDKQSPTLSIAKEKYYKIQDLLIYAPDIFLNELESRLKQYRDLTLKFKK